MIVRDTGDVTTNKAYSLYVNKYKSITVDGIAKGPEIYNQNSLMILIYF